MPYRNVLRWIALVCGVAILFMRAPEAIRNYREWHELAISDPSAAELYETNFEIETAGMVVALGLGLLIFFGLKRKEEPIGGPNGNSVSR